MACKEWNQLPAEVTGFSGESYDNTGELNGTTWRHVAFIEQLRGAAPEHASVVHAEGSRWLMESDVCKHCTHAACLDVCPTGSLLRTEFGTVVVQADVCNGCGYCVLACPFGVIDKREDNGHAAKCTLCYDRLKDGETPACAKACPTESIQFGDLDELRRRADERLAKVRANEHFHDASLYLRGDDDGIGGAGAFFLLLDKPEVYGLPPDPTVSDARSAADVARCREGRAGAGRAVTALIAVGNAPVSASYYGRPIVKPHVWKPYIPWYFWIGGAAGAASVQCVAARARGEHGLARVQKRAALACMAVAPVLLIADLGVPARFYTMLRVFKPTSPMNLGTWILTAFGGAIAASTAAELLGMQRISRVLEVAAALLAPQVTVYTAVLLADTATPVWHEAYETLPFVFAASGVAGAGAIGCAFAPPAETRFARAMMIAGALALPAASQVMERRLGPLLAEPYRIGAAGRYGRASSALAYAGAALGVLGRKSRVATRFAAACVAAAGVFERFSVTEAGKQSALDPKYVVESQRKRREGR